MDQELQKKGWACADYNMPTDTLGDLVKKKDELLHISSEEVKSAFSISFSGFDADKVEYIELSKAITRAFLRYDPLTRLLAQSIWKELKDKFKLSSEIKYSGLPYPIIHFPLDTSESGRRHKDNLEYVKHFYTTWTPLNDCLHKPLSLFENTHKKDNFFLRQLRIRVPFINKIVLSSKKELKPDIHLGEFFVWHGTTDHAGLLNHSGKTTVSIVVSFTSSPIMNGPSLPTSDIEKYVFEKLNIDTNNVVKKIVNAFGMVKSASVEDFKSLAELREKLNLQIKEWNFSPDEAKRFAFTCALWAQRLEDKRNVTLFYFYAFFSFGDNFNTLNKCLTYAIDKFAVSDVMDLINYILVKFGSEQAEFEIKNTINQSGQKEKYSDLKYPQGLKLLKP